MTMERYELHGAKAYQFDTCEAIHDHHLCPRCHCTQGW
jgi:hypothetical protein